MKISQKLDYANRAVLQLAKLYDGKSVFKLDVVSQAENIPSSFLVQIMNDLKKAGVVYSKRGKEGGYTLNRSPENITLHDVIMAIEPTLLEPAQVGAGESHAVLKNVWDDVSQSFYKSVSRITFEELLSNSSEPMWFI